MSEKSWEEIKEKDNTLLKEKQYEDRIGIYKKALEINYNITV